MIPPHGRRIFDIDYFGVREAELGGQEERRSRRRRDQENGRAGEGGGHEENLKFKVENVKPKLKM